MELVKIIGIAFITVIASILIKSVKPELAFVITITGAILILLLILNGLNTVVSSFASIADMIAVDNQLLKILLKIVGIGYVTEFASSVLSDFGGNAISDKVVLGGKITIVIMSLPILEKLLTLVKGFVQLL